MSSGYIHLITSGIMALSFLIGAVMIDIDHIKTHSIKEIYDGFKGEFKNDNRDDTQHFFHTPKFYKNLFIITMIINMFTIGVYMHLKMDRII